MAKTKTAAKKVASKPTAAKPVVEKKSEEVKTPVAKETAPVTKTEVKPEVSTVAPAATEKAPVKKAPAKTVTKKETAPTTAKETVAVKSEVTLQINGVDYDPAKIQEDAIKAAKAIKSDVKDVNIYINAEEAVAYFTVDGIGDSEYKVVL